MRVIHLTGIHPAVHTAVMTHPEDMNHITAAAVRVLAVITTDMKGQTILITNSAQTVSGIIQAIITEAIQTTETAVTKETAKTIEIDKSKRMVTEYK
jgi:hypothetical protein